MTFFDMPLEELRTYAPARHEQQDFDAFWQRTLTEARGFPLNAKFEPADGVVRSVKVFDVTFSGYGGHPIKGWLLLPLQPSGRIPCVVEFIGYGGGRGFPTDWLLWSSTGYAHLIMDTRGQGSAWLRGDTADPEGAEPHFPGFMTSGILNPDTYYYRRLFTDAVRAIETAQSHPAIDPDRIAVTGHSQGGGTSIAAAALSPAVKVTMPDEPFLCHYRRATEITDVRPYEEISGYCMIHRDHIEDVFNTLSYFDGVNFATRSNAQALFAVALRDETCPPSTVFAAYNHYKGPKDIRVWSYNHHEGGASYHFLEKVKFLNSLWPVA